MNNQGSLGEMKNESGRIVRKALFPGTFDPFTIGHAALVDRGLKLVDEIIISIGINNAKQTYFTLEERLKMLHDLYSDNPSVKIRTYDVLTVDFAREVGANFILRGVRSIIDFEYEKMIAETNRKIGDIETIVLFADSELSHISSTHIRELLRYNYNVTRFIPQGMELPNKSQNNN